MWRSFARPIPRAPTAKCCFRSGDCLSPRTGKRAAGFIRINPAARWGDLARKPELLEQFFGFGGGARAGEFLDDLLQPAACGLIAARLQQVLGQLERFTRL